MNGSPQFVPETCICPVERCEAKEKRWVRDAPSVTRGEEWQAGIERGKNWQGAVLVRHRQLGSLQFLIRAETFAKGAHLKTADRLSDSCPKAASELHCVSLSSRLC